MEEHDYQFTHARDGSAEAVAIEEIKNRLPDKILRFWHFCGHRRLRGRGDEAAPGITAKHSPGAGDGCCITITCARDVDLSFVAAMLCETIMEWAVRHGEAGQAP